MLNSLMVVARPDLALHSKCGWAAVELEGSLGSIRQDSLIVISGQQAPRAPRGGGLAPSRQDVIYYATDKTRISCNILLYLPVIYPRSQFQVYKFQLTKI